MSRKIMWLSAAGLLMSACAATPPSQNSLSLAGAPDGSCADCAAKQPRTTTHPSTWPGVNPGGLLVGLSF